MDKGTPQEVKSRPLGFNMQSAVICKGCKHLHYFDELPNVDMLSFPNCNLAVIDVECPKGKGRFSYRNTSDGSEVLYPREKKADPSLERRVSALEREIGLTKAQEEQTVLNRLAKSEQLLNQIAEQLLHPPIKEPPKGQTS
jgi:hypothetical protein